MFEKFRADLKRHEGKLSNPAVWVMGVYRYGRWANQLPRPARWVANRVYNALFLGVQLGTGSTVPREVEMGEAPHLVHHFDIRMHPNTKIGNRVGIMHEVTLSTTMHRLGAPSIGDDVFIGAGAKICGPVKIGDGAVIAPNALVVKDVPAGATAMGNPAKARKIQLATKSEWPDRDKPKNP